MKPSRDAETKIVFGLFVAAIAIAEFVPSIGQAVAFGAGFFGLVAFLVAGIGLLFWALLAWRFGGRRLAFAYLAAFALALFIFEHPASFSRGVAALRQVGD